MAARKTSKTSKRTLIEPHKGDKRYVRRNKKGQFKTEVDVGRSLAADRRSKAKTLNPIDNLWTTAANWTPAAVPNGESDVATFGVSNTTTIRLSEYDPDVNLTTTL